MSKHFWILLLFCIFHILSYAALQWEYDSKIAVTETITETEPGSYLYEYSAINNDTSVIWDFVLYTYFDSQPTTTFQGKENWMSPQSCEYLSHKDYYDPSALHPNITGGLWTSYEYWFPLFGEQAGIQVGESATIMSYITNVYDSSPKYYCYTTIQTNGPGPYLQGTVSAVGQTIPEPATLAFLGIGGLLIRLKNNHLMSSVFS